MFRVACQLLPWVVAGLLVAATPVSVAQVDLKGKGIDPVRDSSGKVVVLVFVRTDCPISNRYAPLIQRLSSQHEGKATFWLVYPDKRESVAGIEKHRQDYRYKLPAVRDPQHVLVRRGQVQITPEVAVFDGKRQLVYHGRIDNWFEDVGRARSVPTTHELDDAVRAALTGQKLSTTATNAVGCYITDLE